MLKTLVAYRLIDPGSEWRLHRQWFDASAMADLLDSDFALVQKNTLYRCLDKLAGHKDEMFKFLKRRWCELFGASFEVLLYDLTSTYFETDQERGADDLRQHGYSRDKRGDCRQVVGTATLWNGAGPGGEEFDPRRNAVPHHPSSS